MTVNMNFDQVKTNVGDNAILNSDLFSFSSRETLDYIQPTTTQIQFYLFNYDIMASSTSIIGDKPVYLTYDFLLSPNFITNTIDLRRGFVASLALFGGFMVSIFAMLSFFVCSF